VTVATNNNAASKLAPLTRTKTGESAKSPTSEEPPVVTQPPSPPFKSNVYCSRACAAAEQDRCDVVSKDLARNFSTSEIGQYYHRPSVDGIITNVGAHNHPHGPPSPLFLSSDTESSNSQGTAPDPGPACSAPKSMDYFRMGRQGPDDAWNEVQRQRRSSMHPSFRPTEMKRQGTQSTQYTVNTASSDSLSSMWDPEWSLGRSTSNPGKMRMTPMSHPDSYSSGPSPIPTRPALPRSNLSHTSLAGSSPSDASLLQSFSAAFPVRNGLSTSYNPRPFALPGIGSEPASTPLDARRPSMASLRPSTGTIKAKPKPSGPTWDSLGKDFVREHQEKERAKRSVSLSQQATPTVGLAIPQPQPEAVSAQSTPRSSLRMENGQWLIVHSMDGPGLGKNGTIRAKHRSSSRSTQSSSSSNENEPPQARKSVRLASSASLMPPPAHIPHASSQPENTPTGRSAGASLPRSSTGYNWGPGKTLPLPANLHVKPQAGLFFFQGN
jgi:hypothetical protein